MNRRSDERASGGVRASEENGDWIHDEGTDDGSSLADLVRWLWRARAWFLYPAFVGALLSLVSLAVINYSSPSTTSYRSAISLTMPGAADGRYSNGLPYTPSDIRSASVLDEVFRRNQLDRYGLDSRAFLSMVAVEAYSPAQEGIIERYRARLGARNITSEERQRIGEEFAAALRTAASDGALVSFTVPDDLNLPREVGLKVVADIPSIWSDIYVNVLGVGAPALARSESAILDGEYAESLDYPLAYDYAVMGLNRLVDRLESIQQQPGARSAVLAEKNVTGLDLMGHVERIRDIEIRRILRPIIDSGLTRDKTFTILSYERTLATLEDDERLALKRAEIVSTIVDDSDALSALAGGGTPANPVPDTNQPIPPVTSIPQFGDVFIDRIVSMALSGAGSDFRKELLRQKLDLSEAAARIATDRLEIERRLQAIRNFNLNDPDMATIAARFQRSLGAVIDNVNELWTDANGILDTVGARNLNTDRQIYASLPLSGAISRTAFWRSPYLLIGVIGTVVGFGAAGLGLYALRQAVRRRSRGLAA